MKKNIVHYCLILVVLSSLFISCADNTKSKTQCNGACPYSCHADIEAVLGILYQQQAAEYRALCYQAYNIAYDHITDTLQSYARSKKPHLPFAIITDLDETALDNSAESAWLIYHDSTPSGANIVSFLDKWQNRGISNTKSGAVPGSVEFFKLVKRQSPDIAIYYISNRLASDTTISATMKVMDSLGFPEAKDTGSNRKYFLFKTTTSSKEDRRDSVRQNHKVILLLGDNLADLDKAFDGVSHLTSQDRKGKVDSLNLKKRWGADYIVFPNAVYGDWEQALYTNKPNSGSIQAHDSIRLQTLDTTNSKH